MILPNKLSQSRQPVSCADERGSVDARRVVADPERVRLGGNTRAAAMGSVNGDVQRLAKSTGASELIAKCDQFSCSEITVQNRIA